MWIAGFALGLGIGAGAGALLATLIARRALRRLRDAERRARAARRMAEIGAMTGGLAHEIKNPLSSIGLNAQLLAEGVDELRADEDEKSRLLKRVGALRREAERLRDILADFLRFAGGVRLEKRRVDLNEIVQETAEFFLPQAEQSGVRLRCDLARGALPVDADPAHFKQALLNLLINAQQVLTGDQSPTDAPHNTRTPSPPRGEIILRTERRKGRDGVTCAVHVIDTGPGIAPDRLESIFTPYFTTKAAGSGLGLPTSRRLIEEHGGAIEVVSEPGRGSDFVIVLPAAADSQRD